MGVLKIGATQSEGGSRAFSIEVGGHKNMPLLGSDSPPVVAYEIWDVEPVDWNPFLAKSLKSVWHDLVLWAKMFIDEGGKLLFLRVMSAHPEYGASSKESIAEKVLRLFKEVSVPVIVVGCGVKEIDAIVMPHIAEVLSGERVVLGNVTLESYKEMAKACIEHGHSIIAESPIDINIAKQLNILMEDMGLLPDKILMYATTGALGYGFEYAYSIMERTRLFGLEGDEYMNKPQIAFVGQEAWKTKEASLSEEMGVNWELVTAYGYILGGADIVVVRHPKTAHALESFIKEIS